MAIVWCMALQFKLLVHYSREVAARLHETFRIAARDRIEIDGDHDDGDSVADADDRMQSDFRTFSNNQIRLRLHQLDGGDEWPSGIVSTAIADLR